MKHVLRKMLYEKLVNVDDRLADLLIESLDEDIVEFFKKGLKNTDKVILAKPFTKYGWYLVLYCYLGEAHKDNIVMVYYNLSDPRWTVAILIHEIIHRALNITVNDWLDMLVDETLAYTASLKSGFYVLYEKAIKEFVESLIECWKADREALLRIMLPLILADKLRMYNYELLVEALTRDRVSLFNLWLATMPDYYEKLALANGLKQLGIRQYKLLGITSCPEVFEPSRQYYACRLMPIGVDAYFEKMVDILLKPDEYRREYEKALDQMVEAVKELDGLSIDRGLLEEVLEQVINECYR